MGFWKSLGKIALAAAPIAAAPFTGGASLLAIGAGAGAAAGAMDGGVKGALLGSGLGAIPGLGSMGQAGKLGTGIGGKLATGASKFMGAGGGNMGKLGNILDIAGAAAPIIGGLASGRAQGKQQDYQNESAHGSQMNNALLAEMAAQINAQNQNRNMQNTRVGDTVRGDIINHLADVNIPDNGRVQVQHFSGGLRPSTMTGNSRAAGKLFSDNSLYALQNDGGIQAPNLTENVADLPRSGIMDKILGIAGPATAGMGALGGLLGGEGGGGPQAPAPRTALSDREEWERLLADPNRGPGDW